MRPRPDLDAADLEAVLGGLEPHVVDDPDARNHEAHVEGALLADARYALEKIGALVLVDERNEAVAELEADGIEGHDRGEVRGDIRLLLARGRRLGSVGVGHLLSCKPDADEGEHGRHRG